MKSLKTRAALPLAAIPALLVTGAALLVLVAGVAGAATNSQPGELLYGVRRPALMLQLALTGDPAQRAELQLLLDEPAALGNESRDPTAEPIQGSPDLGAEPVAGAEEIEFAGTITEIGGGFIVVAGETVNTVNAEVQGVLAVGTVVEVHATRDADGALVAREVSVEGELGDANLNDLADDANANLNANLDDLADDANANLNANPDDLADDANANLNANVNDDRDNFNANAVRNVNSNQGSGNANVDDRDANVNSNSGGDDSSDDNSNGGRQDIVDDNSGSGGGDNSGSGGGDNSGSGGGDDNSGGGGGDNSGSGGGDDNSGGGGDD